MKRAYFKSNDQLKRFVAAMTPDQREMLKTTIALLKERVWDRLHEANAEARHYRLSEEDVTRHTRSQSRG
jgi:hypothetical protein